MSAQDDFRMRVLRDTQEAFDAAGKLIPFSAQAHVERLIDALARWYPKAPRDCFYGVTFTLSDDGRRVIKAEIPPWLRTRVDRIQGVQPETVHVLTRLDPDKKRDKKRWD